MTRSRTAWLLLAPILAASSAAASGLAELDVDGLYTWRVAAVEDAPAWCCYRWQSGTPTLRACDLDGSRNGYSSGDDALASSGEMQIYVDIKAGKPADIRTLSTRCAVHSRRNIIDLGSIATDDSLAWLQRQVAESGAASDGALASIAVHRGSAASQYLAELARSATSFELRKESLFWIGQTRIGDMAATLEQFMFQDRDAEIREHAAFAWSQSRAPNRSELLIRQGREDADTEVRAQAWFWLAQTAAAESESAIRWAIEHDSDVREEAVFALSQLPDERAVDALLVVLHNKELPQDTRERALFWLAQSESERAHAYIERLLAGTP